MKRIIIIIISIILFSSCSINQKLHKQEFRELIFTYNTIKREYLLCADKIDNLNEDSKNYNFELNRCNSLLISKENIKEILDKRFNYKIEGNIDYD